MGSKYIYTIFEDSSSNSNQKWSSCGIILNNSLYGNYVVASRRIEEGELIIEERPLSFAPSGTSDKLPFCLTCCRKTCPDRCSKCRWPICGNNGVCENDYVHANAECPIFVENAIHPEEYTQYHYTAIEVLRCLLLQSQNFEKWSRVVKFESHTQFRNLSETAKMETKFIANFVNNICKLKQYEFDIIEKITGIVAMNTFGVYRGTERYSSLLFDKVTLLAHDCDPNTSREIVEDEVIVNGILKKLPAIQIIATRTIECGEVISIYYTKLSENVYDRRKYLKKNFYFDCSCSRCVKELMENIKIKQ